ncbi:hypothetical protein THUN1379_24500 [Paludibacterium sp. THUN1379]|uniref:DEAD/DEAH box helicase n=1 Tax=Paludibacterium sp. THUN1379 TaxID=3112107 RepID=UPI0030873E4C|nr:hypothetical protein THUN1379_24500 [Paludibacterium sp. THUN1379]
MFTPHHRCYYAHELTLRAGGLRPAPPAPSIGWQSHQLAAAGWALHGARPEGAVLADEVGLGKSIQAGLVLAQGWAERQRRLLVLCPAGLRAQWQAVLRERLALPAMVLTRAQWPPDTPLPGVGQQVLILSYGFAWRRRHALQAVPWDWVVLDEAHKLRAAQRDGPGLAADLRRALQGRRKLLLTATPLQNQLMELFGVSCLLSPYWLGPEADFRRQFLDQPGTLPALRQRWQQAATRTLRCSLPAALTAPPRRVLTQCVAASAAERALYQSLSHFIAQASPALLPARGRGLLGLLLKKRLASSPAALLATLQRLQQRLRQPNAAVDGFWQQMWAQQGDETLGQVPTDAPPPALCRADRSALARLMAQAQSLGEDSKLQALLHCLAQGLARLRALGAPDKAVLFTESTRTQACLARQLQQHGYAGRVICVNGQSGSARPALLERFRQQGQLLIATEAVAEGVNLQCCALVVNVDLPWNPQRLEQRIGRCQRFGQPFEVVVLNLLSPHNQAERRLLSLLQQKSRLFDTLFGTSEGVLGQIAPVGQLDHAWPALLASCRSRDQIEAEQALLPAVSAAEADALLAPFDQCVRDQLQAPPGLRWPSDSERKWQALRAWRPGLNDEALLTAACALRLAAAYVLLDHRGDGVRHSELRRLRGQSGWLRLDRLLLDDTLRDLLFSGCLDDGSWLDDTQCRALWQVPARFSAPLPEARPPQALARAAARQTQDWQAARQAQDTQWFATERQALAQWVTQQVAPAEARLRRLQTERRRLQRAERDCREAAEQVRLQQAMLTLADSVREAQQGLAGLEEAQAARRAALLADWQPRQRRAVRCEGLWVVRWRVG